MRIMPLHAIILELCDLNGLGTRQNLDKAKDYFGKACDLGIQIGCDNYKNVGKNNSSCNKLVVYFN